MSVEIHPSVERGTIIRAHLPHFGEETSWPRNLLVHGFVFARNYIRPHAIAVSRFSYNAAKLDMHDVIFPVAPHPVLTGLYEDGLMVRTDRIDIIPLDPLYFGAKLRPRGYVHSPAFWAALLPQLDITHIDGGAPAQFLTLQPGDRVTETLNPRSAHVPLPRALLNTRAPEDIYALALQEKQAQDRAEASQSHRALMAQKRAAPRAAESAAPEITADVAPAPVITAPIVSNEPWWKQDPQKLEELKRAAAAREVEKTRKPVQETRTSQPSVTLDAETLSGLFNGARVKSGRSMLPVPAAQARPSSAPKQPAVPLNPREQMKRQAAIQSLVPLFEEAFATMFEDAPPSKPVTLRHEPIRGTILRIHPMRDVFERDKYGIGIVWDIFRDDEGAAQCVELVPIRREQSPFPHQVPLCNPYSTREMVGFVALPDFRYRILLNENYLYAHQPQEKIMNPCFLHDIERAGVKRPDTDAPITIWGVANVPDTLTRDVSYSPKPSEDEIAEYKTLLQIEQARQSAKALIEPNP